jgi:hypothetical protein
MYFSLWDLILKREKRDFQNMHENNFVILSPFYCSLWLLCPICCFLVLLYLCHDESPLLHQVQQEMALSQTHGHLASHHFVGVEAFVGFISIHTSHKASDCCVDFKSKVIFSKLVSTVIVCCFPYIYVCHIWLFSVSCYNYQGLTKWFSLSYLW